MNSVDVVISVGPLLGALVFCLSWLIQVLTRIENRVTKLEVLVDERMPAKHREEEIHATTS